jgi:hypothetical protein
MDATDVIDGLLCTKSRSWEYEREWRGIHREAGRLYTYEAAALKAVSFGPEMNRHAKEIICLILDGQNPDVEIWAGRRSEVAFRVEFQKKEYMRYIDAKRRGLTT